MLLIGVAVLSCRAATAAEVKKPAEWDKAVE